ncbi:MAG: hypothetical protein ABJL67_10315 [Sulfitobacter sp.]
MPSLLRPALFVSLLGLAACDELAVANDPAALADVRGNKSCLAAVKKQTGATTVSVNTTLPVVETNRFIIDVQGANSWTCVTDNNGRATQIVERQTS